MNPFRNFRGVFQNLILFLLFFSVSGVFAQPKYALLPYPQEVRETRDSLDLSHGLFCPDALFVQQLRSLLPALPVNNPTKEHRPEIIFHLRTGLGKKRAHQEEGYSLRITPKKIIVEAVSEKGFFYALQTLRQLVFQYNDTKKLPCLDITDYPRFQWRGMHLDCSRHFFTVPEVKQYIDMLSMYKMNVFHWHLTDDQGWRIEIKKYPLLTSVGGWRNGSMIGKYSDHTYDSIRYGGSYSQDEIRDVVAYAAARHITVVPEIEMPGHSMAALSAYPQYACFPKAFEVEKGWGVFDDVFCTKDSTLQFIKDVLDEVCALFPSAYIHIGGDECPKTRWKACPQCQQRIKTERLNNEEQLQSWFVQTIEKYLNGKGKKIIGWDEILEGGLAPNAAVMSWRGEEGGLAAASQSHPVVMTPGRYCYFDHYQDTPVSKEPLAIGGYTPLARVYSYNPIPEKLAPEKAQYILGAQGNVWTEYITSFQGVQYMSTPRMCALAEVLWTNPKERNYEDFIHRLTLHSYLLDRLQINYCPSFLYPR